VELAMPAPPCRIRQNWPIGLYETVAGDRIYYYWRDPLTGKFHGVGADFDVARTVALRRNDQSAKPSVQRFIHRRTGSSVSIRFSKDLDARNYSETANLQAAITPAPKINCRSVNF